MAKFAALFIAAFAFQVVLADSNAQENPHVRKAKKTLHTVSDEAVNSIQNVQPANHQGKHAVASIANEYALEIQVAVYHLHHAIQHNHQGHGQQVLQQVAESLSDIAHQVQQAVHQDPDQIKNVLKSSVQSVNVEADKLAQVAHQLHQHAQQGEDNVHEEVQDVLYELLDATRQLHIRGQLQQETHQQTKEHIQQVTNDVSNVIQSINTNDQETAHELAHLAHQLSHVIGHVVHHLQIDVHHHEGENKNIIRQVLIKLSEIRASLDEVVNSHGQANVQARVSELKNKLKTNVHNVAAQIERLVQLVQNGNQSNQDDQDVSNLVKSVVASVLSAEHNLHRQLQVGAEH